MNKVVVLMSTYNGEKYLRTQLDSILEQKNVNVEILVRDDGSTDSTIEILKEYESKGLLKWYTGENLRPAKSFMNLVKNAPVAEYYAFSDQDDVWLPEKLSRAIEGLCAIDGVGPKLYYSTTILVDKNLKKLNLNYKYIQSIDFNTAVVSSNATGCTMCFNKELLDIVNLYTPTYQMMHDGWIHKVCLAVSGKVYCDKEAYIYYRQHDNNVIGGKHSFSNRWKRRFGYLKNRTRVRSKGIHELLNGYSEIMSEENRKICKKMINYRYDILDKINLIFSKNIHGADFFTDLMYRLAVVFNAF